MQHSARGNQSQGRRIAGSFHYGLHGARVASLRSTWRTQGRSWLAIRDHAHAGRVDEDFNLKPPCASIGRTLRSEGSSSIPTRVKFGFRMYVNAPDVGRRGVVCVGYDL